MPLSCELGCGTVAYREDIARHLEKECVEKKVECPFIKYKCEVGLIKRKELNQHLEEKRTEHTELKLSAMEEIVMQQSEMITKQNGQFKTLLSITNTTKLEWRIQNVVNSMTDYNHSTSQQFQVDRFNFILQLIHGSIYIYQLPATGII
ncbi:hypothetical protein LOD99_9208 [Oopsacas minuta]|uniref:TRAF-type domain-containing protein n=1 Tax=Oopsacas minuta TaxID=111878 RepID=A0AAV7JDQ5_9METZ|nr:hypothetical protein LOD99_9208 [Oopsacas minuta]